MTRLIQPVHRTFTNLGIDTIHFPERLKYFFPQIAVLSSDQKNTPVRHHYFASGEILPGAWVRAVHKYNNGLICLISEKTDRHSRIVSQMDGRKDICSPDAGLPACRRP